MSSTSGIERNLLREQVRRAIVQRILNGQLPAGNRINESELALELGVSRTPLREALHHLEQQRFVESLPGRGFLVAPLSRKDVREIYPLVALLEGYALRTSVPLPDLDEARRINEEMFTHRAEPESCLALDAEFHDLLVENCANERLLDVIKDTKRLMQRYESAYMQQTVEHPDERRTMESSVREHRTILDCLAKDDVDAAGAAVEVNWHNGMERLLELLGSE